MNAPLLLRGGRLIDPASGLDGTGDLLVAGGVVVEAALGSLGAPPEGAEVIDASGLAVMPGFIDLHVHLREPGFEEKETIATGARAAARGGFTTICCMPNTDPAIDSRATLDFVMGRAATAAVRVLPVAAVSKGRKGAELVEMAELAEGGAVAFSDDGSPVLTPGLLRSALAYAKTLGLPIMDHCEEPSYVGCAMHEGHVSTRLGLRGQPAAAEDAMVARGIQLAELTGGHFHAAHMSTLGGLDLVRRAKERGIPITAEVAPHHLTLTDEWVAGDRDLHGAQSTGLSGPAAAYDTNTKVNPPLRPRPHVEALIEGLADGSIDAIATDHAPHATVDKLCEYDVASYGISGFETAFGALMTLVHSGRVPLPMIVAALTVGPARVLGAPGARLGRLTKGAPADVTIADLDEEWTVDPQAFASLGKNTPLGGQRLKGRVVATLSGGVIVHDERREAVTRG